MKKLLGLLGTIMITGNAIPSVIAAAPNRKHSIKKRQNNENTSTIPKAQDEQQSQFLAISDSKIDIIEKEITLNKNYSDNIQKMLQELIDENYIDPLRSINMGGLISKELDNKTNTSKLEELEPKMANWIKKQQNNKNKILILTLKNSDNKSIKLVINLNNFYLLGFINNQNQYFYFDDELLEKIKQKNKENIEKLEKEIKETSNKNKLGKLNKNLKNLQGEGLKTEEIKTKTLNTKVTKKYNCQKINLNYTGEYSENGLNVVIKEKGKPNRAKDIIISRDTLNNAIKNLSFLNNESNQNQTTKNDLAKVIFITSEAMRFGSHIKYFNYKKMENKLNLKIFQKIFKILLILKMMTKFNEKIILNN